VRQNWQHGAAGAGIVAGDSRGVGVMEMNTKLKFGKYYICYLFLRLY